MKFLFISPVVWNFYKLQNQALPEALSLLNYETVYLNPVKYTRWKKNIRFADVSNNLKPEKLTIVERRVWFPKSVIVLFYENFNNVWQIVRHKPDVVVSYDHLMSILPCLFCYIIGKPFIFNVSDDWDNVPQNALSRFYWKYISKPLITKMSTAILSISNQQLEIFSKKSKKTHLLPNGKEVGFLETMNEIKPCMNEDTVIFIGNLRDWYDFDLMFEVFKELPELRLQIFGLGPMYKALESKAQQYDNIEVKGNLPYEKIPEILKSSFCGIIPLKLNKLNDSTCPVKLFDYWAAGKAVIATPTKEVFFIGEECVLFAESKEAFVKHLIFLKNNPNRKEVLAKIGFEKVTEVYNYQVITQKFLKIVNTIIDENS
ncbi:MAG: glycosyltransferase [Bacteroidales bacterium]|nr:glycosyltransferase [Bacteroidales bacterium]